MTIPSKGGLDNCCGMMTFPWRRLCKGTWIVMMPRIFLIPISGIRNRRLDFFLEKLIRWVSGKMRIKFKIRKMAMVG